MKQDNLDTTTWLTRELVKNEDKKHLRNTITIWMLIIALVASNMYWVWYNSQWEYETTETVTVESDGEGNANYIRDGGEINNGTNKGDN